MYGCADGITDAEAAVGDSAQLVTDPIDFSYMGVYTIWMNDPGSTVVMSSDTSQCVRSTVLLCGEF